MSVSLLILRSPLRRRVLMILAAMALLGSLLRMIPPLRERVRLQHQLIKVMEKRSAQEILHPLFAELSTPGRVDSFAALFPPDQHPLQQDDVATVSTVFEALAMSHGFALGKVHLDIISDPPRRLLAVVLPLQGAYEKLGALLKDLLLLPSLESLERIDVQFENAIERITIEIRVSLE